jgi:allantoin racemase
MKIWYQSVASLGQNPVWDDYEKAVAEHIAAVKRPETQVDVKGIEVMVPSATEFPYLEYVNVYQIKEGALRAEEQGYDALIVGCLTDPGYGILRSILNIPVIFSGEISMHLACLVGKRFSVVGRTERTANRIFQNVETYGLAGRAVPPIFIDTSLEMLAQSFRNPSPLLNLFFQNCDVLISRGAEVIIPGCGILNALLARMKISKYKDAAIVDTIGASIKLAEAMAELRQKVGLEVSRIGEYRSPGKELMAQAEKVFQKQEG